jgi:hypothetical protein
MGNRKPHQTGPQDHAEGEHGRKTQQQILEQLRSGPRQEPQVVRLLKKRIKAAFHGKRRLVEDRQQHDEADKNSEQKRLYTELERHRDLDGPSDNREALHGLRGHKGHRADYKLRGPDGLPIKP